MGEHISETLVKGFRHAGISAALDNCCEKDEGNEDEGGEEEANVLSDEDPDDETVTT